MKFNLQLSSGVSRVVELDPNATKGATIGTNLFMSDGSLATAASLAAYIGAIPATGGASTQNHSQLAGLTIGNDHPQYQLKSVLTTRGDLYARGASDVVRLGVGTSSQLLRSNGTDPTWVTISPVLTLSTDVTGTATFTNLGNATLATTITANAVTNAKFRQSSATSVVGRSANSAGDVADIAASADGDVLRRAGGTLGFGAVTLATSNFANPSASIGLTAVNGTALTAMRSDGAPALSQAISPTWTGNHVFAPASGDTVFSAGGVLYGSGSFPPGLTVFPGNNCISSNQPNLFFVETDAAADEGTYRIVVSGGDFFFFSRNDAGSVQSTFLACTRTGAYVTDMAYGHASGATTTHTFNGPIYAGNGSAGSPSVSYASDIDSGTYRSGANSLRGAAGGVDSYGWDNDSTAGNTRFLIYDVDNGTLERVTVGAADSGGTGFKVLRIPN